MKFRVIFAFILPFVLFEETISQGTTTPNIDSTTPKNQTAEVILLGYNDFKFQKKIVHFLVHLRIPRLVFIPKFITLVIYIVKVKKNIRLLAEEGEPVQMTCEKEGEPDDDKFKFKCEQDLGTEDISKITIDEKSIKVDDINYDITATPGALYLRDKMLSIDDKTADFFVKSQIPMTNCVKKEENNELIIEGNFNEAKTNKDTYAIIVNDGNSDFKNITGKLSKNSNKYRFTTSNDNKDLNFENQLATYDDTHNIIFDFSDKDEPSENSKNYFGKQKKKSGLSGGAIVAIVVPCSVALIAIAAGSFIASGSKPQMAGTNFNNNIGDSTSGMQLKY